MDDTGRSAQRCAICDSGRVRVRTRGVERYVRCRDCRSLLKLITLAEYRALKPTYDPGPALASTDPAEQRRLLEVDDKRLFLEGLRLPPSTRGRFLDIGCGAGGYLLAATELGYQVEGLEPSTEHSRVAREVLRFPVRTAYFERQAFPPRSFQLVMLSHVVEHIYEPRAFLEDVFSLVAPGGTLVVVTPNADALVTHLTGVYWSMLKTIDHVSMLAPKCFLAMGVEDWGQVTYRTSEYPWEPAAVLAVAARDAIKGRLARRARVPDARGAAPPAGAPGLGVATRTALAAASIPLHLLGKTLRRGACLVMEIQRRP